MIVTYSAEFVSAATDTVGPIAPAPVAPASPTAVAAGIDALGITNGADPEPRYTSDRPAKPAADPATLCAGQSLQHPAELQEGAIAASAVGSSTATATAGACHDAAAATEAVFQASSIEVAEAAPWASRSGQVRLRHCALCQRTLGAVWSSCCSLHA